MTIKTIVTMVFALMLASSPLFAKSLENGGRNLQFGVRLGPELMQVLTDADGDIYANSVGLGGTASFDVLYNISQSFVLHASVGVDFRDYFMFVENEYGYECENVDGDCGYVGSYTEEYVSTNMFFYLEIPLMLQWKTSAVFVEAGPVFDVLLFSKEKNANRPNADYYDDKLFAVGVSAGVGHVFSSGLFIDFRVSFQFSDLVEKTVSVKDAGTYYEMLKFQLGFGYWF